jgi:hypothetical protein
MNAFPKTIPQSVLKHDGVKRPGGLLARAQLSVEPAAGEAPADEAVPPRVARIESARTAPIAATTRSDLARGA